jgi:hypothetical protein
MSRHLRTWDLWVLLCGLLPLWGCNSGRPLASGPGTGGVVAGIGGSSLAGGSGSRTGAGGGTSSSSGTGMGTGGVVSGTGGSSLVVGSGGRTGAGGSTPQAEYFCSDGSIRTYPCGGAVGGGGIGVGGAGGVSSIGSGGKKGDGGPVPDGAIFQDASDALVSCVGLQSRWKDLVRQPEVLSCASDNDCTLKGQTSTCSCSFSMAGDGVAVSAAAYTAAGGDILLTSFYANCQNQSGFSSSCCDCAPRSSTGCVNGQCAIVTRGCCMCPPDGGVLTSTPDARDAKAADAPFDVSTMTSD